MCLGWKCKKPYTPTPKNLGWAFGGGVAGVVFCCGILGGYCVMRQIKKRELRRAAANEGGIPPGEQQAGGGGEDNPAHGFVNQPLGLAGYP